MQFYKKWQAFYFFRVDSSQQKKKYFTGMGPTLLDWQSLI